MKNVFTLVLVISIGHVYGQNLVLNPSFEEYTNCPDGISCVPSPISPTTIYCNDWFKATELGTSDYHSSCVGMTPNNPFGHQPARTGNAYMGLHFVYDDPMYLEFNYREYIQGRLSSTLIAGHNYYCSYYVSLAEMYNYKAIDQVGACLTNSPYYAVGSSSVISDLVPKFTSDPFYFLSDTLGWQKVEGQFMADGGEEWIIIGSFMNSGDYNVLEVVPFWLHTIQPYHYIDDVCLLDIDGPGLESSHKDTVICMGASFSFKSNYSGAYNYVNSYNEEDSTINIVDEGTYFIKAIDYDNCALYVDSITVSFLSNTNEYSNTDTIVCPGTSLSIGFVKAGALSYSWNTGENSPTITTENEGVYYVKVDFPCGLTHVDTFRIDYFKNDLSFELNVQDTAICNDKSVVLFPQIFSGTPFEYLWNTGEITSQIKVDHEGTYVLTIYDNCGFSVSDSAFVSTINCTNCITIPNAFSPNNDGKNDVYNVIVHCSVNSYSIAIFNRWGNKVFASNDVTEVWNGEYLGKACPKGVYFYIIQVNFSNQDERQIYKGDITLL